MWQTFGHKHATNILDRQLESQSLAHAYLLEGPAGVGKFALALEFAQKIVGSSKASPDIILIDLADNPTIEELRNFLQKTAYSPVTADYTVAIINNMHLASKSVSNALLKSLEEPAVKTIFILVTSSKHLLPTIISRVQTIHLNKFSDIELREFLNFQGKTTKLDIDSLLNLSNGSTMKLMELVADPDKFELLSQRVSHLQERIEQPGYYQRLLKVNELAELDDEELKELILSWTNLAQRNLSQNPNVIHSLRLAWQTIEKLKQHLNKKMVLQHFLLNVKV